MTEDEMAECLTTLLGLCEEKEERLDGRTGKCKGT